MAWATIEEAQQYTGISVGQDNIEAAQGIIEMFADVTELSNEKISTKNLRLLKMAVAYQAAWMSDHPDLFTHVDISTMLQDGIQFTNAHANSGVLAPLAKRAIDRLSWRRNRSIRVRARRQFADEQYRRLGYIGNTPEQDDNVIWYPF
jgi:hypothetical protein